jgi:HAD superfamily hydrolase (TIGR01509 family)
MSSEVVLLIPLGGSGERFKTEGFMVPKALVPVDDKPILFWLLDEFCKHNEVSSVKCVCIPYNKEYEEHNLGSLLEERYPALKFEMILLGGPTRGAAETVLIGLNHLQQLQPGLDAPVLCIDSDNFYTTEMLRSWDGRNCVFSFSDSRPEPIFSYVEVDNDDRVLQIIEKQKISDNANCGAYGFRSLQTLSVFCSRVIDENIRDKNEFYTSTVIRTMMGSGEEFCMVRVPNRHYFSLGTPNAVREYQHAFLLDLDGTLVNTDAVYVEVWNELMKEYSLCVDGEFFNHFIAGNSDFGFLKYVMPDISEESIKKFSESKDRIFIEKLQLVEPENVMLPNVKDFFQRIKNSRIAIVTSCNRASAEFVLQATGLEDYVNLLVAAEDVQRHKPDPEPFQKAMASLGVHKEQCTIFEDSLSGYTAATHAQPAHVCVCAIHGDVPYTVDESYHVFGSYAELQYEQAFGGLTPSSPRGAELSKHHEMIKDCLSAAPIKSVKFNLNDKLKTGYICDICSLTLTHYNARTSNVVLKLSNLGNELSNVASKLNLYTNEAYFYEKLHPVVQNDIRLPKYFGQYVCDGKVGILLGDLRDIGGFFDWDLNKDMSMLLSVVKDLHSLHTAYYFTSQEAVIAPMKDLRKINEITYYPDLIEQRFDKFMHQNAHFFLDTQAELLRSIASNYKAILNAQSNFPLSFCHGDAKSPNLFYPTSGAEPTFLDWQYIHLNKGVSDIGFLLVESVEYDRRRAAIVVDYYYELCKEHNPDLSYETYMFDFKCALCIFPFFVTVWFNSEDPDKLLDKAFPLRFMKKMLKYYDAFLDSNFASNLE